MKPAQRIAMTGRLQGSYIADRRGTVHIVLAFLYNYYYTALTQL
jgi:hypothetical protein